MGYKKVHKIIGMRQKAVYIETPSEVEGVKGRIRNKIEKEVSDKEDLIADLYKLTFINLTLIKELYKIVNLDDMDKDKKDLFLNGLSKYEQSSTILVYIIEKEDVESFLDRVIERQEKIYNIVKEANAKV